MSLFKQKIDFNQFLANLIAFQFDFLKNNFNKLVVLADEFKVLTEKDKEELLDKTHELMIADIFISCGQHFHHKLPSEEIGKVIGAIFGQYLIKHNRVAESLATKRIDNIEKLFKLVDKTEVETQKRHEEYEKIGQPIYPKIKDETEKQKFYLCSGFGKYYAGEDIKSENWEGKKFAAFKLAKAFVINDVVGQSLKHYSIIF